MSMYYYAGSSSTLSSTPMSSSSLPPRFQSVVASKRSASFSLKVHVHIATYTVKNKDSWTFETILGGRGEGVL